MARLLFIADTEGEIALSAATAKTVLQVVAPANHRVVLKRWGVFCDGVSPTAEPVQVRLLRQTTAGTMSAATPRKMDGYAETIQSTAQKTASAEPTAGDVLAVLEVHPQQGYAEAFPYGDEPIIAGGGRVGIECTAPAGVNVRAQLICEE